MIIIPTADISELVKTIESLRQEMLRVGKNEGLSSEKTIYISQMLDFYIAKYQATINR